MLKKTKYETIDLSNAPYLTKYHIFDIYPHYIVVTKNNKYGIVSLDSKKIDNQEVKLKYDYVHRLDDGTAIVTKNDKCSLIDEYGNEIIEPIYDAIFENTNGILTVIEDNLYGLIKSNGEVILEPTYSYIRDFEGNYTGVYDTNTRHGIIDRDGNVIMSCQYHHLKIVGNKYAILNFKWVIDLETKKEYFKDKYYKVSYFGEDRFIAEKDSGKVKLVDINNHTIKKFNRSKQDISSNIELLSNGLVKSKIAWHELTLLDRDANVIVDKCYDIEDCHNGYVIVGLLSGENVIYYLYNAEGKKVINRANVHNQIKNINTKYLSLKKHECAYVAKKENSKYGLITLDGIECSKTFIYDRIDYKKYNIFVGYYGGQQYLINEIGNNITFRMYDDIEGFTNGISLFKRQDIKGIINSQGKEIVHKDLDYINTLNDKYIYGYKKLDDKHYLYSLYDMKGNIIFKDKLINQIALLNDDIFIINNHLIDINYFKIKYLLEIVHNEKVTVKEFRRLLDREDYINHFNNYYIEEITKWLSKRKKLIDKNYEEINNQLNDLYKNTLEIENPQLLEKIKELEQMDKQMSLDYKENSSQNIKQLIKILESE